MRKRTNLSSKLAVRSIEGLERRDLLAGDVTLQLFRGDLHVHGDAANNHVEISQKVDEIVVRGLDGTTIHGRHEVSFPASHLTDDLRVQLGHGDDTFVLSEIEIPDDVYVRMGSGDDAFMADHVHADAMVLEGEAGSDELSLHKVVARNALVDGGGTSSTLKVTDSEFHGDLAIRSRGDMVAGVINVQVGRDFEATSYRTSSLLIQDTDIRDDTVINGYGPSQILIEDSTHHDSVRLRTWWYEDLVSLDGVTIGGNANVSLGWRDDILSAVDSTFAGRAIISGSRGTDALNADNVEFTRDPQISGFETQSVPDLEGRLERARKVFRDAGVLEDQEIRPTILDIVTSSPDFELLGVALGAAGLADVFGQEGTFTVFAPTNSAFGALGETLNVLIGDPAALGDILKYHVLDETLAAEDLAELSSVTTLQGQDVSIEVTDDGGILIDGVLVRMADVDASNGIVHVIETVLVPEEPKPTIAEIVAGDDNFSTLLVALQTADLVDVFTGDGDFTVFAPTDAAFAALDPAVLEAVLADPSGALTQILTYHVVGESLDAGALSARSSVTTLQGQEISIEVVGDSAILNDTIKVELANVEASNGIVHVIDAVLLPQATITDVVAGNTELSRLNELLEATGLNETLRSGEFTLFAPTNAGLSLIPPAFAQFLLRFAPQVVRNILLNHVVEGRFDAATLLSGQPIKTLGGRELQLEVTEDGVRVNGTSFPTFVAETDLGADNGIVHVIDNVLI